MVAGFIGAVGLLWLTPKIDPDRAHEMAEAAPPTSPVTADAEPGPQPRPEPRAPLGLEPALS